MCKTKRCNFCGINYNVDHYNESKFFKDKKSGICPRCEKSKEMVTNQFPKLKPHNNGNYPLQTCSFCKRTLPISYFETKVMGRASNDTSLCAHCIAEKAIILNEYDMKRQEEKSDRLEEYHNKNFADESDDDFWINIQFVKLSRFSQTIEQLKYIGFKFYSKGGVKLWRKKFDSPIEFEDAIGEGFDWDVKYVDDDDDTGFVYYRVNGVGYEGIVDQDRWAYAGDGMIVNIDTGQATEGEPGDARYTIDGERLW